jgi:hypothetical protein
VVLQGVVGAAVEGAANAKLYTCSRTAGKQHAQV